MIEDRCQEVDTSPQSVILAFRFFGTNEDGDEILVYEARVDYSVECCNFGAASVAPLRARSGVGSLVSEYLTDMGQTVKSSCGCNKTAAIMDANGPKWCRENLPAIVRDMVENAKKLGHEIGFVDRMGIILFVTAMVNKAEGKPMDLIDEMAIKGAYRRFGAMPSFDIREPLR